MPTVQKYKWSKMEGEMEYDAIVNKSKENNIKSKSKRRRRIMNVFWYENYLLFFSKDKHTSELARKLEIVGIRR